VHTWDAANYILRRCASAEDERAVFEVAGWLVRLNIMRFDEFRCPQKPMAVKRGRRRTVGAACRSQRSAPNLRRQTEMRRPAYAAP
jgi:hypothetical protein